jgi:hypothetical protein
MASTLAVRPAKDGSAIQPKETAMLKKLLFLGTAAWALSRWVKFVDESKSDPHSQVVRKPEHIMDWEGEGGSLRPPNPK